MLKDNKDVFNTITVFLNLSRLYCKDVMELKPQWCKLEIHW
jgi:hypothetical protein